MLFFLSIALTSFSWSGSSISAERELEKIGEYFYDHLKNERTYFKFSTQIVQDDVAGEKIVTEVWSVPGKVKYSNPFMTVWQDESTQVVAMKESKKVILRKPIKGAKGVDWNSGSIVTQVDSLRKVAININCRKLGNGMGAVVIELPLKVSGKPNPVKRIELQYVFSTGEIKSGIYDYYLSKGTKRELYEYLDFKKNLKEAPFSGTAVSQVLSGKGLKTEFAKYSLVDLRGKK